MFKDFNPDAFSNIADLIGTVSSLPEKEFEEAIMMIAALSLGTIRQTKGKKFLKGFVSGALSDNSPVAGIQRRVTKH